MMFDPISTSHSARWDDEAKTKGREWTQRYANPRFASIWHPEVTQWYPASFNAFVEKTESLHLCNAVPAFSHLNRSLLLIVLQYTAPNLCSSTVPLWMLQSKDWDTAARS
jgi:hypothetical protein